MRGTVTGIEHISGMATVAVTLDESKDGLEFELPLKEARRYRIGDAVDVVIKRAPKEAS